jgi:hypothetical protein
MAIASGKVNHIDRLLSIGIEQKKGARGLMTLYSKAAKGYYSPKSFTEEEDMKAILNSTTSNVLILSRDLVIGCVRPATHLLGDEEASAPGDNG